MWSFILFADDTNLFYSHKNADVLCNTWIKNYGELRLGFSTNKLSLNVKKTHVHFMIFKTKRKN